MNIYCEICKREMEIMQDLGTVLYVHGCCDQATELAQLQERVMALESVVSSLLEQYHAQDDEFTPSFYVNEHYEIVDPVNNEWKALLTMKQIMERRAEAALKASQK